MNIPIRWGILEILNIKFSGVLPGDIVSGDWVECSVDRFDIYE